MEKDFIPPAKPIIGDEEREAVDRVMRSGMIAQGPEVATFEREFAAHFASGLETVAVNSGTSGQHLGLLAAGVGPGDEVIVPSFTFAATGNSVALTGATPVFADIEPDYYSLDPQSIKDSITERTKGIMPVHLYGHPMLVDEIEAIAKEHGLEIYEDAAQAHGASWKGRKVGTLGAFGMFSLYPTKNMTSGEGGMVACKTPELARSIRLLRNQGMEKQYENEVIGFNNRMTDIHAAIGRVQLTKVDAWTAIRQSNAKTLTEGLSGVAGVQTPKVHEHAEHVYHQYTIRVDASEREHIKEALAQEHGVGTGIYYPIPNHRLPSLKKFAPDLQLTETERAASEVLSLPVHPSLSESDLERIVHAVTKVVTAGT